MLRRTKKKSSWLLRPTVNNETSKNLYIMIACMISNLHKKQTLNSLGALTSLTLYVQILALWQLCFERANKKNEFSYLARSRLPARPPVRSGNKISMKDIEEIKPLFLCFYTLSEMFTSTISVPLSLGYNEWEPHPKQYTSSVTRSYNFSLWIANQEAIPHGGGGGGIGGLALPALFYTQFSPFFFSGSTGSPGRNERSQIHRFMEHIFRSLESNWQRPLQIINEARAWAACGGSHLFVLFLSFFKFLPPGNPAFCPLFSCLLPPILLGSCSPCPPPHTHTHTSPSLHCVLTLFCMTNTKLPEMIQHQHHTGQQVMQWDIQNKG